MAPDGGGQRPPSRRRPGEESPGPVGHRGVRAGQCDGETPPPVADGRPRQTGAGQRPGGQGAVAHFGGRDLVGLPLDRCLHRPGHRAEEWVGGRGDVRGLQPQVVVAGQVGGLVGEQHPPLAGRQRPQHRGRDDHPTAQAGQRVGVGLVVLDHDQPADVGTQTTAGERRPHEITTGQCCTAQRRHQQSADGQGRATTDDDGYR